MRSLRYFLFAIILFMAFTTRVEALKCQYKWDSDLYSYEDNEGNTANYIIDISLETEDDSNRLTTGSIGIVGYGLDNFEYEFANGKGIALESDGSCPTISVYSKAVMGGYKIYKNNKNCKDGFLTTDSRCSPDLTPSVGSDDTSTANDAGKGGQFKLVDQDSNSCDYELPYTTISGGTGHDKITIKKKKNNKVSGSCDAPSMYASFCQVKFGVEASEFYPNNTFTCPPYLNASLSTNSSNNPTAIFTIFELGRAGDIDRTEGANESWQRDDAVSSQNWDDPNIDCPDIFSEEPGSVGSILRTILGYIRIIGPVLVVLLSAIDFIKAIFGFDEKAMGTAQRKLIIRLIAAVALFLVPTLIDVLLDFINATTCTNFFK